MLSKETQERIEKDAADFASRYMTINEGLAQFVGNIYIKALTKEVLRSQQLEEVLEDILTMGLEPGEINYDYAFNRCWRIANDALDQYKTNLK